MNQTAFLTVPEALSADTLAGMRGMLAGLSEQVPVVVLRGGKDVFCSGLALGDELAAAEQALVDFVEILLGLRAHPAAKLALVEGKALGGGVGLAAVCDLVVATHEARFALPEVLIGMTPATILPVLEERMSLQKTRAMMLDGGTVTAEEALAFGLVDRTCPPDRADRVMTRLSRTLRRAEPKARQRARQATTRQGLRQAMEDGARETLDRLQDPAVLSRIAALAEGQAPWDACEKN